MSHRGFSLVGMLFSLLCLAVLLAIAMPALQQSMTGIKEEGGKAPISGWGLQDQMNLYALMQSLNAASLGSGEPFPQPSEISGSRDIADDTTANLYSVLVMQRLVPANQLVSQADFLVDVDRDYDFTMYDPRSRVYWDPAFSADLHEDSNVSYAHMPLYGDRLRDNWSAQMSSSFPLFGNRGPKDGIEREDSYACFDGLWGGYVAFGDGHVDFLDSPSAFRRSGDGLFSIDDEARHSDAILGFTELMNSDGPVLQWD